MHDSIVGINFPPKRLAWDVRFIKFTLCYFTLKLEVFQIKTLLEKKTNVGEIRILHVRYPLASEACLTQKMVKWVYLDSVFKL